MKSFGEFSVVSSKEKTSGASKRRLCGGARLSLYLLSDLATYRPFISYFFAAGFFAGRAFGFGLLPFLPFGAFFPASPVRPKATQPRVSLFDFDIAGTISGVTLRREYTTCSTTMQANYGTQMD